MNWADTPEEAEFRAEVRAFVRDRFPADYTPDTEDQNSLEPEDVQGYNWPVDRVCEDPVRRGAARRWAAILAERGWIAPGWPVSYGGAGLSAVEEFILQEEMMRARVPTVNGIGAFLLGPTLIEHGSDGQKADHLPGIAKGEVTWAQGFSEPGAGSDLAAVRTKAVRDGDHYVVNGQKVWTSLGQYADWLFVLVRTDSKADPKHRGLTFLLVDTATPGVTVRPITDMRDAQPYSEIFFDDVRVPAANRVGEENRGWYVAMTALGFERAGIGATIKYEQILRRLIDSRPDPALRWEIARRYTEIRVLYNLARLSMSGESATPARLDTPGYEASVNQLFSAELHQRLARTGAAASGRAGLLRQDPFTRLRLDSVAATFLGGTSEIQRNVIATRGLKLPRG